MSSEKSIGDQHPSGNLLGNLHDFLDVNEQHPLPPSSKRLQPPTAAATLSSGNIKCTNDLYVDNVTPQISNCGEYLTPYHHQSRKLNPPKKIAKLSSDFLPQSPQSNERREAAHDKHRSVGDWLKSLEGHNYECMKSPPPPAVNDEQQQQRNPLPIDIVNDAAVDDEQPCCSRSIRQNQSMTVAAAAFIDVDDDDDDVDVVDDAEQLCFSSSSVVQSKSFQFKMPPTQKKTNVTMQSTSILDIFSSSSSSSSDDDDDDGGDGNNQSKTVDGDSFTRRLREANISFGDFGAEKFQDISSQLMDSNENYATSDPSTGTLDIERRSRRQRYDCHQRDTVMAGGSVAGSFAVPESFFCTSAPPAPPRPLLHSSHAHLLQGADDFIRATAPANVTPTTTTTTPRRTDKSTDLPNFTKESTERTTTTTTTDSMHMLHKLPFLTPERLQHHSKGFRDSVSISGDSWHRVIPSSSSSSPSPPPPRHQREEELFNLPLYIAPEADPTLPRHHIFMNPTSNPRQRDPPDMTLVPPSIKQLYNLICAKYSDYGFVYALSAQLCQDSIPMECYIYLKMTLLASLCSYEPHEIRPPIPIWVVTYDGYLANLIMRNIGQLAPRYIGPHQSGIHPTKSALTTRFNWIPASPVSLAQSGVYFVGSWTSHKPASRYELQKCIENGAIPVPQLHSEQPLEAAIWTYWHPDNVKKRDDEVVKLCAIFGMPTYMESEVNEVLVDFIIQKYTIESKEDSAEEEKDAFNIPDEDMRAFIKILHNRKTNFTPAARHVLKKYYCISRIERPTVFSSTTYVVLKQLAEAFAKLSLRQDVLEMDVTVAIFLCENFMQSVCGPCNNPPPPFMANFKIISKIDPYMNNFTRWLYSYLDSYENIDTKEIDNDDSDDRSMNRSIDFDQEVKEEPDFF